MISKETLADLADLMANGPTASEFGTGIEQLRVELQLIDNVTLATAVVTSHLYPDQPVDELAGRQQTVDELTAHNVQNMVGAAFNPRQRIEVRQVPRP